MFTPAVFYKSCDPYAALTKLDAATDDQFRTESEYLYVGELNQIVAGFASGEKIRQAKLTAPSLRRMFPYHIKPYLAENNLSNPPPVDWRLRNPLILERTEGLYAEVKNKETQGLKDYVVAVIFSDGPIEPIEGPIYTVRFTTTGTPVAHTWSPLAITFDESLPAGRYQIVGADLTSGSGMVFRFIPIGALWRPGGFSHWRESIDIPQQRNGRMGVWAEFEHSTPPTLEVWETGADEPSEGYMDLIQIRAGVG